MKTYVTYISFLSLLFTACNPKPVDSPNILWITCEDISPAWGCYGDEQATTPNIDGIASKGHVFTQAFSNAPICAPARSTLITGIYATSLGTQNLRSEIPVPDDLKILPELLKQKGYFTTNNAKTDYNFSAEGRWDESSRSAHWRNRNGDRPFFSVFNFGITHEGHANSNKEEDTRSLDVLHDPNRMNLPPYLPETEEFRKIMAHQYDLITVFDQEVGKLLNQLEEDGLRENTLVFIFSDHGYGLPRHKRWLYHTGLQVPFVLYIPDQYKKHLRSLEPEVDDLVAFVDFAPTVLDVVGIDRPMQMEGQSFLNRSSRDKKYIFGFRDRADDVYDMSRSVYDGRYLYIRHFMPHRPYIDNAVIFNKGKRSFEELFRLRDLDKLSVEALKLFAPKPAEELYDLQKDPAELINIIHDDKSEQTVTLLRAKMRDHMLETFDTGLLNEGDMMERAGNTSVYAMMRGVHGPDLVATLESANQVNMVQKLDQVTPYLQHEDAAVRFWALTALDAHDGEIKEIERHAVPHLTDPSQPNQVLAAEILLKRGEYPDAIVTLSDALDKEPGPMLLQTAISLRQIGARAKPLAAKIENEVYPKIEGDVWGKYKSWIYPMFIGMALDQTLENCAQDSAVRSFND